MHAQHRNQCWGEHTDIHITLKKPSGPHSIIVLLCGLYEALEQKSRVLGTDESNSRETKFSVKLMSEDLATVIANVFCCFHSQWHIKTEKSESHLKSRYSDTPCSVSQDGVIAVWICGISEIALIVNLIHLCPSCKVLLAVPCNLKGERNWH